PLPRVLRSFPTRRSSDLNRAYRMRKFLAPTPHGMAISDDEHAFFIALGQRIATQRKARDITQVELAERLGISQQAMNSFEKGRRDRKSTRLNSSHVKISY